MNSNLNQLRIFYTVAREGSFSKAAKILYISQPAISKAVSSLEESFDARLLIRSSRGVSLTYEGKILFDRLKAAFEAISEGVDKVRDIKRLGMGKIRIGASESLCKYILLPYLKEYIEKNPHIKVTIECQSSAKSLKRLENGELDMAVAVRPERTPKAEFLSVGEIEDIFVAAKSYIDNLNIRAGKELTSNEILKNGSLMLLDEENITRVFVDKYLKENNIEVKKILEVTNMDLLIDFAKIGIGIACVIKQFVSGELEKGDITEIGLQTPMNKRTIGFAFCTKNARSDTCADFYGFIKEKLKKT